MRSAMESVDQAKWWERNDWMSSHTELETDRHTSPVNESTENSPNAIIMLNFNVQKQIMSNLIFLIFKRRLYYE